MTGGTDLAAASTAPPNGPDADRPSSVETWAVPVLTVLAGLFALAASGRPTMHPGADAVLRFAFAALVTFAASRARRWSWLALAGVTAAASVEVGVGFVSFAALGLAVIAFVAGARPAWLGALVGLLATGSLLRLPEVGPHGFTAVVVVVATAPLLVSAARASSGTSARRVRLAGVAAGAILAVVITASFVALVSGGSHVDAGIDAARDGIRSAKEGDAQASTSRLDEATVAFADAEAAFDGPLVWPAQVVPGLGQQVDALRRMAGVGTELTSAASDVSGSANYRTIPVEDGQIDLQQIASFAGPLAEIEVALTEASSALDQIESSWLVPPLRHELDALRGEVDAAGGEARVAADVVAVAPDALGANGARRYFIAFTTPAESRGAGGFVGSWAELTAEGGQLELTRSGRGVDLGPAPGDPVRTLDAPIDYLARYGALKVQDEVRDVTLSPDFPSVARVLQHVYPQTPGGQAVDGVILVDPYAIAAMLQITGPIRVEGYDTELTTDNAADILLRRQYLEFEGANEDRVDFLEEASRKTFNRFIRSRSLRPAQLARVLGPVVSEGRFLIWSADLDEQNLITTLGLDGTFPYRAPAEALTAGDPAAEVVTERQSRPAGAGDTDFFAITTNNGGNNKIDTFLTRSVDYGAAYDPATGSIEATATVVLRNDAPSSGLPEYVIKNRSDSGQPMGTNWLWFNVYSPHLLTGATLDGQPLSVHAGYEFGLRVYDAYVAVPAGGEVTLELRLSGEVRPGSTYRLGWYRQPLVEPDEEAASVTPMVRGLDGSSETGETLDLELPPGRVGRVEVELPPP